MVALGRSALMVMEIPMAHNLLYMVQNIKNKVGQELGIQHVQVHAPGIQRVQGLELGIRLAQVHVLGTLLAPVPGRIIRQEQALERGIRRELLPALTIRLERPREHTIRREPVLEHLIKHAPVLGLPINPGM